jgi:hypothetical protein
MSVPTPVNIKRLAPLLEGYDPVKKHYLLHCLTYGFSLECDPEPQDSMGLISTYNHQSALRHSQIVT